MNPVETVLRFLERINERNADRLAEMMTEDHVFTDSLGQTIRGREKMRAAWRMLIRECGGAWNASSCRGTGVENVSAAC
jgi:ketosteroid isomerase-like protein